MIPTSGLAQKPWGTSARMFVDAKAELHVAHVLVGGYSSRHQHQRKWNTFSVVDGTLVVRTWREGAEPDDYTETVVHPAGPDFCVPPGVTHQFIALTGVLMYEFYKAVEGEMIDPDDIVRFSEHGRKEPHAKPGHGPGPRAPDPSDG